MIKNTTVQHHLDVASLMSCSAGSQPEALAVIIVSHLAVCPQCYRKLSQLSRVGEAMFEALPKAQLDYAVPIPTTARQAKSGMTKPATLELLAEHLQNVEWEWVGSGARAASLPLSPRASGDLCVIDLSPGATLPEQAQKTGDLTFVITGCFRDDRGTFRPGDVADYEFKSQSAPVADAVSGCRLLIASDTALIYRSPAVSYRPSA